MPLLSVTVSSLAPLPAIIARHSEYFLACLTQTHGHEVTALMLSLAIFHGKKPPEFPLAAQTCLVCRNADAPQICAMAYCPLLNSPIYHSDFLVGK